MITEWRKPSRSSNGGNCVEICVGAPGARIRDTKQSGAGPALLISHSGWAAFLAAVKA